MTAVRRDQGRSAYFRTRSRTTPFLFQSMLDEPDALNRLDIRFRWGNYGVQLLRCHLTYFAPGTIVPSHEHRDYEFHFIPQGRGTLTLAEGTFPLQAGMFYLTGPHVVHQQQSDIDDPMYELCLHVDLVKLHEDSENDDWGRPWEAVEAGECVRQLNTMSAAPTVDQYNGMHWFLTAYRAWQDRELCAYTTIQQAVVQIMLRAARAHHVTQIHTALPARDMNAYRYQLATQYMRDNYTRPLTLDEVAAGLHICGRQLQRIFEEHAHETFSSYLEGYRLAQVCIALTHVDQTVEQVAIAHGFSSGSYLHYVFKKRMGITPLQYREQQRAQAETQS